MEVLFAKFVVQPVTRVHEHSIEGERAYPLSTAIHMLLLGLNINLLNEQV